MEPHWMVARWVLVIIHLRPQKIQNNKHPSTFDSHTCHAHRGICHEANSQFSPSRHSLKHDHDHDHPHRPRRQRRRPQQRLRRTRHRLLSVTTQQQRKQTSKPNHPTHYRINRKPGVQSVRRARISRSSFVPASADSSPHANLAEPSSRRELM